MGGVAWTLLCAVGLAALISSTVISSKRKTKPDSEESEVVDTSTSRGDDAVSDGAEMAARPEPKRQRDVTESSNTTNRRRSRARPGPHVCQFCKLQFETARALGGHRRCHRHNADKEQEKLREAENLVEQGEFNTQYDTLLSTDPQYNMQGGDGGGTSYYPISPFPAPMNQAAPTFHNPSLLPNQGFAAPQQNAQMSFPPRGGPPAGTNYPPTDNTGQYSYAIPPEWAADPAQQFHTPNFNPEQTGYVDSTSVMHGGVDQSGQSIFNSSTQGGTSTGSNLQGFSNFHDTNTASNNQQVQPKIAMPPESYISRNSEQPQFNSSEATQIVDQHGNAAAELLPRHPTSSPKRNENHEEEVLPTPNASDVQAGIRNGADQLDLHPPTNTEKDWIDYIFENDPETIYELFGLNDAE